MVTDLNAPERGAAYRPDRDWPMRRWGLAVAGCIVALAIHHILTPGDTDRWTEDATRIALATFLGVAGICIAFVVERGKLIGSLAFSIVAGLVVASVLYWSGDFRSWEPWRLVSALLTVGIAAPLFQGWRDGGERGRHIPYAAAHDRAWANVCLWFAAWGFVGISFLLAWLLAMLFNLIGIGTLEDMLEEEWFALALAGTAFGGAVGLLRDHERIVSLIQRVAMLVLSVLAPVLAVGLVLFLLALPFTGLDALWETTKATTPILLSCVIGALILANAVIGDGDEGEPRMHLLRWSAMALGATILPLGIIAAVSTGLRIDQYGFTPTRLWAATFTGIACAFGLAYAVSLIRGRGSRWTEFVRPANLNLALGLCALAFLLSTPIISFGAIATRDQVARLNSGRTPVDRFDFAALRFDFGPAGMKALKELARAGKTPAVRMAASEALKSPDRYGFAEKTRQKEALASIVVAPAGTELPQDLRDRIGAYDGCGGMKPCNIYYEPAQERAVILGPYQTRVFRRNNGTWTTQETATPLSDAERKRIDSAFAQGKVEIRSVTRQQVFVDGKPVGAAFE